MNKWVNYIIQFNQYGFFLQVDSYKALTVLPGPSKTLPEYENTFDIKNIEEDH